MNEFYWSLECVDQDKSEFIKAGAYNLNKYDYLSYVYEGDGTFGPEKGEV